MLRQFIVLKRIYFISTASSSSCFSVREFFSIFFFLFFSFHSFIFLPLRLLRFVYSGAAENMKRRETTTTTTKKKLQFICRLNARFVHTLSAHTYARIHQYNTNTVFSIARVCVLHGRVSVCLCVTVLRHTGLHIVCEA